ncbi:MAG: efflux transporter periplasmic adaptor subunit [Phycisphaerales bacterium]|nr:efflux transporter periplasmic adaptor subunit [Phycisphaerales bacterium]
MKTWLKWSIFAGVIVVLALGWVVYFHNPAVAAKLPKWAWLQATIGHLGEKTSEEAPADEDPDNTKNEIPIHTARVSVATLHRYVEGFGAIAPRPQRGKEMAGGANLASPVAGVIAEVLCQVGQTVHAKDPVIQLDDRVARSAEQQATAALAQAQASLAALKATPRPDQLQIAQLGVEKARSTLDFAQKAYDRQKLLAVDQGVSGKSVEQASMELNTARGELAISEKQLAILKASPTPEDLHQEEAKVAQAAAALATARTQRELMTIKAPIDATVVSLSVNPGEAVDTTRTIVQFVALDRLVVNVDVPADQLPAKPETLSAQILPATGSAPRDGDAPIIGKVSFVSPQVDPRNGAVTVSIDIPATAAGLRPGLSVRVRIIAEEHKDCLAVPREAVVADENGDSVISLVEGDQATHKTVKPGLEEEGLIEITADGIKEGDVVATAGAFGLPAASRVKIID